MSPGKMPEKQKTKKKRADEEIFAFKALGMRAGNAGNIEETIEECSRRCDASSAPKKRHGCM